MWFSVGASYKLVPMLDVMFNGCNPNWTSQVHVTLLFTNVDLSVFIVYLSSEPSSGSVSVFIVLLIKSCLIITNDVATALCYFV